MLSQTEAERLLALPKYCIENKIYPNPLALVGIKVSIPLVSEDEREEFFLDIERHRINFQKMKYQHRGQKTIVLVRLDIQSAPHRNPDGTEVPPTHVHVYRERYDDKWAYPITQYTNFFSDITNAEQTLRDFLNYCNIVKPPIFDRTLFQR